VIAGILGSLFLLVKAVTRDDRRRALGATALVGAVYFCLVPSTPEAFYWATGALTYSGGAIALMALLALLCAGTRRLPRANFLGLAVAATSVAAFACGTTETVLAVTITMLVSGAAILHLRRLPGRAAWSIALGGALVAAYFVAIAPGNSVRGSFFGNSHDLWYTASQSLLRTFFYMHIWLLSPALIASVVVLLPRLQSVAERVRSTLEISRAQMLWFVPIWLGLVWMTFVPAYWAMGEIAPARVANVALMIFLLGVFPTAAIIVTYLYGPLYYRTRAVRMGWAITAFLLLGTRNFPRAVHDLFRFAPDYASTYDARVRMLGEARGQNRDIELPANGRIPTILVQSDYSENPEDWRNLIMARYFQVRSVRVVP
jgi:hypothetical protein